MTAPAELVIEVTADDIRLGEPRQACLCPIALAAARLLGTAPVNEDVVVGVNIILATLPGDPTLTEYELPEEATQFIIDFEDSSRTMLPFTFTARLAGAS